MCFPKGTATPRISLALPFYQKTCIHSCCNTQNIHHLSGPFTHAHEHTRLVFLVPSLSVFPSLLSPFMSVSLFSSSLFPLSCLTGYLAQPYASGTLLLASHPRSVHMESGLSSNWKTDARRRPPTCPRSCLSRAGQRSRPLIRCSVKVGFVQGLPTAYAVAFGSRAIRAKRPG